MNQPMQFVRTAAPEEQARANFYSLLSRLFYAPPDAPLLEALAQADELEADDEALAAAWRGLCAAAATADAEAVREEHETVFVGTGKAPVTLYTSAYSIKYSNEAPLAALRGELAALGLKGEAAEPEDHIAALCDVMRYLIAQDKRDLAEQKRFFERWIQRAAEPLCAAIERNDQTSFYKHVARTAKTFFSLEHSAFEML
jgi:TorA maturation chaperone TorD